MANVQTSGERVHHIGYGAQGEPPAKQATVASYWSMPPEQMLAALGTTPNGLQANVVEQRLAEYGPNVLQQRNHATGLHLFLSQFTGPIVLILLFATVVSAVLGDWVDASIILAIVFGSAFLSFVQEYSANNAVEKLHAQIQLRASVVRNGLQHELPSDQIVPGDIVLLSAGDRIPADGVVVEAKDLFVNQAMLTGETFPVEKQWTPTAAGASLSARTNMLFLGTSVSSGTARMVVVQTGTRTALGSIAGRLALRPPETDFERGVRHLGYLLSEVTFVLVMAVFAANVFFAKPILDSLLFSLALAVGLTPQLLPAIININLSRGAQAMAKSGVLVRRLASIENFGAMDVLCTDKTGTLTVGVVQLNGAFDTEGNISADVQRAAYLNAHFQTGMANPLDDAILARAASAIDGVTKSDEVPYDFNRKRLSIVVQENNQRTLITKGALDTVLAVSTHIQTSGGVVPLDARHLQQVRQRFADWSGQGYRVLGVASANVGAQAEYTRSDEHDLCFLGFLLFLDPPKPGVRETLDNLASMGVHLKIITGDNQLVAQHIAQTIGITVAGVVTGAQLAALSSEALLHVVDHANLFAEVDPNQKERIIDALQKTGHVVGYMGDGINDAPALYAADIGISVDTAVDVAKDAADFVLMHKDLAVLREGIVQGRTTFTNTMKYIFMATSANFGNMFSVAGASLFLPFLPFLPKQILLLNFLTDLPQLTIASDRVDDQVVQQPQRWDIGFIRRFMLIFGPLSSVFDYITFGLLFWWLHASQEVFHTGWFVESVWSALLVIFVLRSRLPFFRSRPSRAMVVVSAFVGMLVLALPYTPVAPLLGFTAIPLWMLGAVALISLAYVATTQYAKHVFYAHASIPTGASKK